jgi:N utilization substance protein B
MNAARHQAREAALQILYFCQIAAVAPDEALATFFAEHHPDAGGDVRTFAHRLVSGVLEEAGALDALIVHHSSHWRLERMALIDRLILRLGAWELQHVPDTPAAVVLNEAIELARTFSADESARFVNGVLDAIRKTLEGIRIQDPDAGGDL